MAKKPTEQEKEKEQKHDRDEQSRGCEQRAKKARETNAIDLLPAGGDPTSRDVDYSHTGEHDGIKYEIMNTCSTATSGTDRNGGTTTTAQVTNSFRMNKTTGNLLRLTVAAGKSVRAVGGVLVACSTNIKVRKRMDLKASAVIKQLANVPSVLPLPVPISIPSSSNKGGTSMWYNEISCQDEDGDNGWILLSLLNGQIHTLDLGIVKEYTIMNGQFLACVGDVVQGKTKGMFTTYTGDGVLFVITYGSSLSCTLENEAKANDSFCVDRSKLIAWTSDTVEVQAVNKKFIPTASSSSSSASSQHDLVQLSGSGHVIVQCNTGKQLASWLYDCKAPS